MKKTTIIILGILLVGAIIYLFTNGSSNSALNNSANNGNNVASSSVTSTKTATSTTKPKTTTTTSNISGTHVYISILKNSYSPKVITIKAGTTVTWTNTDVGFHSVTADTAGATSEKLSKGQTYSYKFSTTGIFGYHDSTNATTTGMIIIN